MVVIVTTKLILCLVPINYFSATAIKQLHHEQGKACSSVRAKDWRHLLLLIPFILDNLLKDEPDEVTEYNRTNVRGAAAFVDSSDEIVKVAKSTPTPSSRGTNCIIAPLRTQCNKMSTLCCPWETGAVSNNRQNLPCSKASLSRLCQAFGFCLHCLRTETRRGG